jgi:hypothetical protein
MEQEGEESHGCTYNAVTAVNNLSSVGMVPERSLPPRPLQPPPARSAPIIVQRDTQGRVARSVQARHARHQPQLRWHGAREVVAGQVPATTNIQVNTHHRSTRHAGRRVVEAYRLSMLVINPSSVGMVPVRSLLGRFL